MGGLHTSARFSPDKEAPAHLESLASLEGTQECPVSPYRVGQGLHRPQGTLGSGSNACHLQEASDSVGCPPAHNTEANVLSLNPQKRRMEEGMKEALEGKEGRGSSPGL